MKTCLYLLLSAVVVLHGCSDDPTPKSPDLGSGDMGIDEGPVDGKPDAAPSGAYHWHKVMGGDGEDRGLAVAVDGSGNVYVVGYFWDTVDLGGGPVTAKGPGDIFITSFSSTGSHRWQKTFGNYNSDISSSVAVDSNGNVYLAGTVSNGSVLSGTFDLGGGPVTVKGSHGAFVTSFTSSGAHRWQRAFDNSQGAAVAVDGGGDVYVAGSLFGPADLGGGAVARKGGTDAYITSFSSTGTHRWHRIIGGSKTDMGWSLAVGGGGVFVAGSFQGTADLGGGSATATRAEGDMFVSSFETGGKHRWQRALRGATSGDGASAHGVAVDGNGNVYLTGKFEKTVDLGGGEISSSPAGSCFITTFTSVGAHRWQKALGGGTCSGLGVAADESGNIYLTGGVRGTGDLGGGVITEKAPSAFVTSYSETGSHRWQKVLRGSSSADAGIGSVTGEGVAVDGKGNVYVTGEFSGPTNLGGGQVVDKGIVDIFVVQLGP